MALYRDRYDDPASDAPRARIFRNTYAFEPGIKFIGVWDTVGSLGGPGVHLWLSRLLRIQWQFHDVELSRGVENAYHALAIHERRSDFVPTLWQKQDWLDASKQDLQQIWVCRRPFRCRRRIRNQRPLRCGVTLDDRQGTQTRPRFS